MNFANQLMASAEKAATVAKNFKGFDEMADNDEYIHSEGLNVKNRSQERQAQQKDAKASSNDMYHDEANASHTSPEPTWSLLDRPTMTSPNIATTTNNGAASFSRNGSTLSSASPASSISPPRKRPTAPEEKRPTRGGFSKHRNQAAAQQQQVRSQGDSATAMPLLSVVADALQDGSSISGSVGHNRQQASFSGYDSDNEEGSSSSTSSSSSSSSDDSDYDTSDDEEDPIMSQIRQSKKQKSRKQRRKKERKKKRKKQSRKEKKKKKKNPHRFFEELDQRGAMPTTDFGQQPHRQFLEIEQSPTTVQGGGGALSSLKSWIANPLQRQANANPDGLAAKATSFLKRGPLSRGREAPTPAQDKPDEEEFHVLASSNVLGDEELAALAQFSNANQSSWLSPSTLMRLVRKHPRECFILFTLLLGIFVFFFSRKASNEDDVQ